MKRTQTKVLSILLSLALLCSLAVPTAFAADSRYTDTTDHWAETAIERWSDYGIIEGYGDAFNPDNPITRGQMATILSKTLGLTEEAENPFTDISADYWYAPYVLRCYKAGIMLGDDGKANPDAEITRQEAMTMFCRAFGIKADETADLTAFKDSGAIADWALPYVFALINGGIVSGVSSDMIAPADSMSRAALVTILDRAVVQYINTGGEYVLTDKEGIILVTAGDTTLKGETKADILISQATDGKSVIFKDATVTGKVTVQTDTKIITDNAKLPEIDATIEDVTVLEDKKSSTTRRPSGGSSGGSSRPTTSNLTISEEKAVTSGTYNNVTITDAVADGEVTLSNITIKGDMTIKGGGSSSIKLDTCTVQGKVIMAKETGEAPRLSLTNTPIATVEVQKPAIIEAADTTSAVAKIEATADIEIKGENTKVDTIAVPETAESAVAVTVTAGSVTTVEAKAETTVSGASNSVNTIIATAAITTDSATVQKVEIPETATESVSVTVTGDEAVDIEINSTSGASVSGANVTVSTTLETAPDNITIGGEVVTHIHKWGEPEIAFDATCEQNGSKFYTCIADGCGENAMTKKESIPALGHDFSKEWTTCEISHWHKCTRENCEVISDDEDHKWDEGKITTEPACDKEGVKTYTCPVCNKTKTEPIPEDGHTWGDWVKVDEINHMRTCKTDGTHTETADHNLIIDAEIEATCTETGKTEGSHCDICKSVIVEQTTIPALKHDFTGEYEKDADGHWHICERDNCEETDTKAGHTYNTTNCAEVATCTVCKYEKPAGEHTWGKWEKVDDINHKHTCSCTATETAEHKWNDGEITTEPTEEKEGIKTFTCTECGATKTESVKYQSYKAWINAYLFNVQIGWDEKPDGTWYYSVNGVNAGYSPLFRIMNDVLACTEDTKLSFTIQVDNNGVKETWIEAKDIVSVDITDTIPDASVVGQANGTYKIVPNNGFSGLYGYVLKTPDGESVFSGSARANSEIEMAPFAGCTIELREVNWNMGEGLESLSATFSQPVAVSFTPYDFNETVTEVTDEATFTTAMNTGGRVIMVNDIVITNCTISSGGAIELDLNGKELSIPSNTLTFWKGKTVTVTDSAGGGKIDGPVNANGGASLKCNGGTFSFDPTEYVDTATHTVTNNGDGTYTVVEISYSVKNTQFSKYSDSIYCISWDGIDATGPSGNYYKVMATQDTGETWELIGTAYYEKKWPLFDENAVSYNGVKVITVVNGKEVAETETLDLFITVLEDADSDSVVAGFTANGESSMQADLSGITPNTYFYMHIATALDPLSSQRLYCNTANEQGMCTTTFTNATIIERITNGYYLVKEFKDYTLSADGKAISYTAVTRGDWTKCISE